MKWFHQVLVLLILSPFTLGCVKSEAMKTTRAMDASNTAMNPSNNKSSNTGSNDPGQSTDSRTVRKGVKLASLSDIIKDQTLNAADLQSSEFPISLPAAWKLESLTLEPATSDCSKASLQAKESYDLKADAQSIPSGSSVKFCYRATTSEEIGLGETDAFILDYEAPVLIPSYEMMPSNTTGDTSKSPIFSVEAFSDDVEIAQLEIGLGSTHGAVDLVTWVGLPANTTVYQFSNLTLAYGSSYYPALRAVDKAGNVSTILLPGAFTVHYCHDDKVTRTPFANSDTADGSINDPYEICTITQLAAIAGQAGYLDKYFKLKSNLDFTGESS